MTKTKNGSLYTDTIYKFSSRVSNRRYSNSLADPIDISRKRASSASLYCPHPSAMFVGTEAHARLVWLVSPYNSSQGNFDVVLYIIFQQV
jgi:hypothetical protein